MAVSFIGGKFLCKFLFQQIFFLAILADSARKRSKKEVFANYNKTRINIGHQHDRWMELKEALRHKCKHRCHCTCSSEIGTFIINDAGRQAAHKKQPKYMFWSNLAKRRFILMFWRYILTFNAKKNFQKIYQTYTRYLFKSKDRQYNDQKKKRKSFG